jgi:uncharacterized protein YeeX (DUF496 family)
LNLIDILPYLPFHLAYRCARDGLVILLRNKTKMKNLLKTVRDSIAAAMNGRTIEQMETEQRQDAVKNAVDDYLIRHPDWQPSTKPAPAVRQ